MDSLKLYHVEKDYISFLREFDRKVTIVKENGKLRPYVGIVYEIEGFNYFAPFSSPEKDENGELTEEYKQYFDKNNKTTYERIEDLKYGTININNMIPVPNSQLISFNIDDIEDKQYQSILKDQFIYCDNNKTRIIGKANKLYKQVTKNKIPHFVNLSCNFKLIEQKCREYEIRISMQNKNESEQEATSTK